MKKILSLGVMLCIGGTTGLHACPDLVVKTATALIQNHTYTDQEGGRWELETMMTTPEGSKVPANFSAILAFLKTPGIVIHLEKSTFERGHPSPAPAPLLNAHLKKHSCLYAVMKSQEATPSLVTQEIHHFQLNRHYP